jgi:TonB-dependent receptor
MCSILYIKFTFYSRSGYLPKLVLWLKSNQMKRSRAFLFILFVLTSLFGYSQIGTITGTVTIKNTSGLTETVVGAVLYIDSTSKGKVGTQTDFDGKYTIRIEAGKYNLNCKYLGASPIIIKDVLVTGGQITKLDIVIDNTQSVTGSTFEFVEIRKTSGQAYLNDTLRARTGSSVGKGQEEIAKTGADNAGSVARLLPGVTLVDNRFVVVRGLSERYNAVLLNNVLAPSAESDVKAFSFDMIPASMIDQFIIYQSPSADLPGEFSGGAIRISTTDIPAENSFVINYTGGYRSGTSMNPFYINKTSSKELLGLGASSRYLPEAFPTNLRALNGNPQAIKDAGLMLPNNWTAKQINAPIDTKLSFTWSHRYSDSLNRYLFGNITSFSYSNSYLNFVSNRLDYNTYDSINQASDTVFNYADAIYRNAVRFAIVQNNSIRFGKGGSQRITFKNLLNQMGDNETTLRNGLNHEEGNYRKEYAYRYTQRTIYSGQIGGLHFFNNKRTSIDWTLAYSLSRRNDPDWKRVRYAKDVSSTPEDPYYVYVPNAAQPFFLGRLFIDLNENSKAAALNYTQFLTIGKDSTAKKTGYTFSLKTGLYTEYKERTYTVRNLGYRASSFQTYGNAALLISPIDQLFNDTNINTTNGLSLDEDTKKADQYYASNRLIAGYLMSTLPIGHFEGKESKEKMDRARINLGIRMENNIQRLNSNTIPGDTVIVNNNITRLLPSFSLIFNLTERMLIRSSYGKTLNRPEFREIAPLYFYDFVFNSINSGNPSLRTPSIDNYDFKWEYYPRSGENISFGVFYKEFKDAIEVYFVPGVGSGGTRSFTWGNAPFTRNFGAEVEFRKKLDSIPLPIIRNLGIVANAAYISSRVELDPNNKNDYRPMMGQSPWIVNAGIYYQNDSSKFQVNINYNVIGPRIVIVGVPGIQEVYEMPRHQLDISIVKTVGKSKNIDLRLGVTDLLNQETLLLQDANNDGKLDRKIDQRMQYFQRGSLYSCGITVHLIR